ncbi:DUF1080 domain-containing protein [Seonamhaeicola algicola]|uniref:DUF1080 domain-containing protein n=1 Tax=Seonamhaeicola algicola TaxID=1719036 RepID=A0A5C7AI28_9FLAO|nr:family 16 glycoside hydrolase [Seonamhaeicola algicola]TXE06225.1 DUF1080 domain-containing protein [Seonamhaeicola algicola]
MKHVSNYLLILLFALAFSCVKDAKKPQQTVANKKTEVNQPITSLPFKTLNLNDLSAFKPSGSNWKIVGNVIADRQKEKTLIDEDGVGILFNANDQEFNKQLFTAFEHGDIELELDVMMPIKSNSGIYFQGRYEIQLLDSWGVKDPKHSDIGGIYQRWNKDAENGKQGYEGHPPRINAAKAPGLWQHFKIIFHAPKFDNSGKKIKNAWFEEVWLNGSLIHKNVEVKGPTRAAAFSDETARGPLMIQGDHGPVAFKNIKYKLYEIDKLQLSNIVRTEYKTKSKTIDNLDTIPIANETPVDKFTLVDVTKTKEHKLIAHTGTINIPETGDYLFESRTNGLAHIVINNKRVLVSKDNMNTIHSNVVKLEKGTYPFKIIYNQTKPWAGGFTLHVEGPNLQKYSIQEDVWKDANKFNPLNGIVINPENTPKIQRSFVTHKNETRTHSISVGLPEGIHYSYDLATGSLLKAWSGLFLNTTHMWLSRGYKQLGEPVGFSISLHGGLEFANLKNQNTPWPLPQPENKGIKQLGYELDSEKLPTFSYAIEGATISNYFTVSNENRNLTKNITIDSKQNLWHKLADGESIKVLPNNTFIVNNESYYIDFSGNNFKPIIRNIDGKDELLVEVPKGKNTINYSIIW